MRRDRLGFDAHLVVQKFFAAKEQTKNPDRPRNRSRLGPNLVGRSGHIVAAARGGSAHRNHHRKGLRQPNHAAVNLVRSQSRPARAINSQHHTLHVAALEQVLHRFGKIIVRHRIGIRTVDDVALGKDHRDDPATLFFVGNICIVRGRNELVFAAAPVLKIELIGVFQYIDQTQSEGTLGGNQRLFVEHLSPHAVADGTSARPHRGLNFGP